MFHAGLCSVTFRPLTADAVIELAVEAGIEGIEWGSDVHVPADNLAGAKKIRRRMAAAGLALPSYGSYYRLGESEPHPFARYLETALELGTPVIRVWPGRDGSADVSPERRRQLVDDARRIAAEAAAHDIVVATEFHSHSLTDTPESALQLMREVSNPSFRTYWQSTPGASYASCVEGLRAVRPWVQNLHCFHWPGSPPSQAALADGAADWRGYLAEAAQLTHEPWVFIEFVRGGLQSQFMQDAHTLRQLLAEAR